MDAAAGDKYVCYLELYIREVCLVYPCKGARQ